MICCPLKENCYFNNSICLNDTDFKNLKNLSDTVDKIKYDYDDYYYNDGNHHGFKVGSKK